MQGRPQLFTGGRQLSVLVSPEDYQALNRLVEERRRELPGYSFSDELRTAVRQYLDEQPRVARRSKPDPEQDRKRQLHAAARIITRIAREMAA